MKRIWISVLLALFSFNSVAQVLTATTIQGMSSVRNFIRNGDVEKNVNGFSLYNDSASRPVDGTGGTTTGLTLSRTTTNPLAESGSLQFAKDAANRQGGGFSYDFTINRELRGQQVQIDFTSELVSGTYSNGVTDTADSDLMLFVYRTCATATLMAPGAVPSKIVLGNTGYQNSHHAWFQADTDCSSYRLIFAVVTTSASAYTVNFDSIKVGSSGRTRGPPMTDWVSYTPTFTGLGTVANVNIQWRRNGDTLEVHGTAQTGTPTAAQFTVTLPSGLNYDSAKTGTAEYFVAGQLAAVRGTNANCAPSATLCGPFPLYARSTTNVLFFTNATNSAQWSAKNGNDLLGTGDFFSIDFKLPVTGWSSGQQYGVVEDGRIIAVEGALANAQSLTNNTITNATLTSTKDTSGMLSSSVITIPVSGWYNVSGQNAYGANATGYRYLSAQFSTNGGGSYSDFVISSLAGNSAVGTSVSINKTKYFDAGTLIRYQVYQNSGGTLATVSDGSQNIFAVFRLPGNVTPMPNEKIEVRYMRSTTFATTNAFTVFDYDTKDYDNCSCVTTGSGWKFTAPRNGYYRITTSNAWGPSGTRTSDSWNYIVYVYKGGVSNFSLTSQKTDVGQTAANTQTLALGSGKIYLNMGEFIQVEIFEEQGYTTTVADATKNWIVIESN